MKSSQYMMTTLYHKGKIITHAQKHLELMLIKFVNHKD